MREKQTVEVRPGKAPRAENRLRKEKAEGSDVGPQSSSKTLMSSDLISGLCRRLMPQSRAGEV